MQIAAKASQAASVEPVEKEADSKTWVLMSRNCLEIFLGHIEAGMKQMARSLAVGLHHLSGTG